MIEDLDENIKDLEDNIDSNEESSSCCWCLFGTEDEGDETTTKDKKDIKS